MITIKGPIVFKPGAPLPPGIGNVKLPFKADGFKCTKMPAGVVVEPTGSTANPTGTTDTNPPQPIISPKTAPTVVKKKRK